MIGGPPRGGARTPGDRARWLAAVALVAACGGDRAREAPRRDDVAIDDARTPLPTTPDLLADVPADSAVVLALREPLSDDAWRRLAWDVGPFVHRLVAVAESRLADAGVQDPVDRMVAALLAELPGPIGPGTRAVVHELDGALVLRVEVADEAALDAAVTRARRRAGVADGVVEGERGALAVVRTGRQLAITAGPAAAIRAVAAVLAGDAPRSGAAIDPSAVPPLGGHVDLRTFVHRVLPGDRVTPACRDAIVEVLERVVPGLPRVEVEVALTAERAELIVTAPSGAASVAPDASPRAATPGIPATFPGRPIVGLSFVASADATADALAARWTGPLERLGSRCGVGLGDGAPSIAPGIRGGALAIYDADTDSLIPTDLQGYVAVLAHDPAALLAELRAALPGVLRRTPPGGGRFVAVPSKDLQPFVSSAYLARAGDALVLAAGKAGRARATEALAPAATLPPVLHLVLDVARLAAPDPDDDDRGAADSSLASEAGLDDAVARLIDTLDVALAEDLRVVAALAPPTDEPAPSVPSPGRVAGAACHRLVDRMWASAVPAFRRLGLPDLAAAEASYRRWSFSFVSGCVQLDAAARACLLGAADPIAAVRRCAVGHLAPPSVDDPFEPDPLAARLHPVAGAPTIAELAGTWTGVNEERTWTIAASGEATYRNRTGTRRYTLEIEGLGLLRMVSPDGGVSSGGYVLASPDELYLSSGGHAYPLPTEDAFLAELSIQPFTDAYVVRDALGCALITEHGLIAPANCTFTDRDGARHLDLAYELPCRTALTGTCAESASFHVVASHLVDDGVAWGRFRRVR